jgi:hypothetical protein
VGQIGIKITRIKSVGFIKWSNYMAFFTPLTAEFVNCSQSGDHPETNLAKFGYILDMKVEKNRILSTFLPTYWNFS